MRTRSNPLFKMKGMQKTPFLVSHVSSNSNGPQHSSLKIPDSRVRSVDRWVVELLRHAAFLA